MKIISGHSFSYVYKKLLDSLLYEFEYENSARNKQTREILDVILTIENPLSNIFSCSAREFPYNYLAGELIWYFMGRRDVHFISRYSKFWQKLADSDGNLNSAYGYLLFQKPISDKHTQTQWMWALDSLIRDKDTRQAIIRYNNNDHQYEGNKDFVCTLISHFFIRDNELHMTTQMRSSDIVRGLTFDFPFFSLLQQQMRNHLLPTYPELKIGYNRLILGSSHIYSEHYNLAKEMLDAGIFDSNIPELSSNLIDNNGNPSDVLKEIEKRVEQNRKMTTQLIDQLHNWIYNNAFQSNKTK